jgi:hypothetical protein
MDMERWAAGIGLDFDDVERCVMRSHRAIGKKLNRELVAPESIALYRTDQVGSAITVRGVAGATSDSSGGAGTMTSR